MIPRPAAAAVLATLLSLAATIADTAAQSDGTPYRHENPDYTVVIPKGCYADTPRHSPGWLFIECENGTKCIIRADAARKPAGAETVEQARARFLAEANAEFYRTKIVALLPGMEFKVLEYGDDTLAGARAKRALVDIAITKIRHWFTITKDGLFHVSCEAHWQIFERADIQATIRAIRASVALR
jgi:hypothetical protein